LSFHWFRTVFWLIPTIAVYTIVLGLASITSSFFDRRGHFAHGCARAWSWLILATTGVDVSVTGLERLEPRRTYATAPAQRVQSTGTSQAVTPPSPIVAKDR
jgi:1-acyl-sn-glycerol-3-phosphate acyltransferase